VCSVFAFSGARSVPIWREHRLSSVAVIAWGSLVWNRGCLHVVQDDGAEPWREDGPVLPLEFSRKSKDGRLTLVIDPEHGACCTTLWAWSSCESILDAQKNLREREGTDLRSIGAAERRATAGALPCAAVIQRWLADHAGVKGVVWTALASNWTTEFGEPFSVERAVRYLKGLSGEEQRAAKEYFERAPASVRTPLRAAVEERMKWMSG
jgi:hypothetical protein